jgi:hypothetical protein
MKIFSLILVLLLSCQENSKNTKPIYSGVSDYNENPNIIANDSILQQSSITDSSFAQFIKLFKKNNLPLQLNEEDILFDTPNINKVVPIGFRKKYIYNVKDSLKEISTNYIMPIYNLSKNSPYYLILYCNFNNPLTWNYYLASYKATGEKIDKLLVAGGDLYSFVTTANIKSDNIVISYVKAMSKIDESTKEAKVRISNQRYIISNDGHFIKNLEIDTTCIVQRSKYGFTNPFNSGKYSISANN